MVVQSLECGGPIQSSIASDEIGAQVGVDSGHLIVCSDSPAKKGPKCNLVTYGRRGDKSEVKDSKELFVSTDLKESTEPKDPKESAVERRVSARIHTKQRAEKELLVRRRVELLDDPEEGGSKNRTSMRYKRRRKDANVGDKEVVVEEKQKDKGDWGTDESTKSSGVEGGNAVKMDIEKRVDSECGTANLVEKSDSAKVKDTLRLFNKHYLHFVQEEEKRCAKVEADRKSSKKGSKSKKGKPPVETKSTAKRPDLKAISKMMGNKEILHPEKRIGSIPGIKVGHQFYSRAEMVAVGFHSHWLCGIDYMGQSYSKGYSNYTFPLAVAIVLSGMYEDDLDNAEDVVYTGQGGHNLTGNKRQNRDQVMERGNLALKNCVEQSVPVRVVRGHESSSSYCGKVYTYDGLYKVVTYWAEKGISGFTVFKYRLRRVDGQPLLTTNQVHFTYGRVPQSVSEIRGLVCKDITVGQENIPIPATNLVDEPPVAPTGFTYCKSIQISKNVKLPTNATGCNCKENCIDPKTCTCAMRNGADFPYVSRDGGRLIEAKDVVFECGPTCGCGPGCVNRTSQRGLKYRLEVFRTPKKGWAVRSWDFIPSGAPVCEYTGILTRTEDLDHVSENSYIFDIDCLQTMRGLGGRERRLLDVTVADNLLDRLDDRRSESVPEFCIDAGSTGNIARFINHSCEPNLFVQCVLSSHHDIKLARVVLFAADNIPPLQELTYDYGYALDSVFGPDGKVKQMPCFCGAGDCKKRLF
ncbi:histone-lysine N-methyltransferase, H3 lysine-9 specific SUVH4 [Quillaja saponaria]|uniref:Histone-lysine N-methyltransferase, H3 lysine-9 specific SUVH4 n=1 Tax=Quillaja saponaria TaxID=32244 RepID=A0AAD7VDQ7_QUISA|nr:histone-lysine N-methyltransferase, H3 lysine-9 specific SUVH4 [Quillaja saponaria]